MRASVDDAFLIVHLFAQAATAAMEEQFEERLRRLQGTVDVVDAEERLHRLVGGAPQRSECPPVRKPKTQEEEVDELLQQMQEEAKIEGSNDRDFESEDSDALADAIVRQVMEESQLED